MMGCRLTTSGRGLHLGAVLCDLGRAVLCDGLALIPNLPMDQQGQQTAQDNNSAQDPELGPVPDDDGTQPSLNSSARAMPWASLSPISMSFLSQRMKQLIAVTTITQTPISSIKMMQTSIV